VLSLARRFPLTPGHSLAARHHTEPVFSRPRVGTKAGQLVAGKRPGLKSAFVVGWWPGRRSNFVALANFKPRPARV